MAERTYRYCHQEEQSVRILFSNDTKSTVVHICKTFSGVGELAFAFYQFLRFGAK